MTPLLAADIQIEPIFMALLVATSVGGWIAAAVRLRRGGRLLEQESRYAVPWDGVFVGLAVCIYFGVSYAFAAAAQAWFGVPPPSDGAVDLSKASPEVLQSHVDAFVSRLRVGNLASLVATAVIIALASYALRASAVDLGITANRLRRDILLGIVAAPLVLGPVLLIQVLMVLRYGPSQHPILQLYRQAPGPDLLLWSGVAAVLIAPLVEEFLFRSVLQGWLERLFDHRTAEHAAARHPRFGDEPTEATATATVAVPVQWRDDAIPILLSALLFSWMHKGNGPDLVALFVLGIGLGLLYRRTHRIWAGVVVHMLLNALSLGVMYLGAPPQ